MRNNQNKLGCAGTRPVQFSTTRTHLSNKNRQKCDTETYMMRPAQYSAVQYSTVVCARCLPCTRTHALNRIKCRSDFFSVQRVSRFFAVFRPGSLRASSWKGRRNAQVDKNETESFLSDSRYRGCSEPTNSDARSRKANLKQQVDEKRRV